MMCGSMADIGVGFGSKGRQLWIICIARYAPLMSAQI
jgi:hypothetical protein